VEPEKELHPVLTRRDPDFIRRAFSPISMMVDHYYRTEVEGVENLSDKACIMTATHNGGVFTPDAYGLWVAFARRFGLETPGYSMAHGFVFHIPLFGAMAARIGGIPASQKNAGIVLDSGFPLMVCPGGDVDVLKPFSRRHEINFAGRSGFVQVAIRHQVPIVPVISVGAHEVIVILNDGRRLARAMGFHHLRIKSVPLALTFPFGVTIAGLFSLPLPSKIVIRILPRIELCEPPSAADDPAVVARCYDHVCRTMQAALDDLAARRKLPVLG
jgi:1-acyl-sn-glycerol-3-phosphate acyltransferase